MNKIHLYITLVSVYLMALISYQAKAQQLDKSIADEYYYKGISMMCSDSIEESWNLLKFCELVDSTNAPICFALAENLSISKNNDESFSFLERAYRNDPLNETYAIPYADALQQNGNTSKSIEVMESLIKNNPTNYNLREKLALIYLYSGNVGKAINIYDELQKTTLTTSSDYERYSLAKIRIYKAVGDENNFIKELEKLSKTYPANKDYAYTLLNAMIKNNKYKDKVNKAIAELEKTEETKDAALFFKIISEVEGKNFVLVKKHMNDFVGMPNASTSKKIELLNYVTSSLLEASDSTNLSNISLPIFDKLVKENPTNQELILQYASAIKNIGDSDCAFTIAKDAINADAKNPEIYSASAKLFLNEEDIDKCAYISKKALDNNFYKIEYVLWQLAPLFNTPNKEDESIKTISSYLGKYDWGTEDKSILLGVIGDLYSSKGDTIKAINYYEKSLSAFDNNANVANNYAYLLTEMKGGDLQKAEKLGALAVRLQPNNPNNLDTYAWALYKNKSYTLARIHISKALDCDDKDKPSFTLNAHACYIYMAIGDKENALKYFQKAKEINKANPEEQHTRVIEDLKKLLEQQ